VLLLVGCVTNPADTEPKQQAVTVDNPAPGNVVVRGEHGERCEGTAQKCSTEARNWEHDDANVDVGDDDEITYSEDETEKKEVVINPGPCGGEVKTICGCGNGQFYCCGTPDGCSQFCRDMCGINGGGGNGPPIPHPKPKGNLWDGPGN
jgi:hypothetical protein